MEKAEIPFKSIYTGKLRRYFSWQNFVDPFLIVLGFFQSLWIVIRFWPTAVFVKGGFVSVPVAMAAFLLRRPIVLHESDSVMGLSNRIISRLARHVCVGFPGVKVKSDKLLFTGNPVRESIAGGMAKRGYELTGFHDNRPVLLVWGGSQGAQQVNELLHVHFPGLKSLFQIIHVTGKGKSIPLEDPAYRQYEYVGKELKHLYVITDLVLGRAGANSLYELAFMQKPNVLIPLASAAHDHQRLNAEYFEEKGASVILRKPEELPELLRAVWHDRMKYESMQRSLHQLSRPDSAKEIAELLLGF